jgi:hypothetical protein
MFYTDSLSLDLYSRTDLELIYPAPFLNETLLLFRHQRN